MKRWIAFLPLAALLVLGGLFAAYGLRHDPRYIPNARVGQAMPDAVLPPLSGGAPVRLSSVVQPATLVNFYASWCAPCIQEEPTLMALKAEGVRIVGVAWKDDPQKTRAHLAQHGDPYALTLVDRDGRTGVDFGVSGVPETYLIGADGKILAKVAEPLTADSAEQLLERSGGKR
ncbi:redoxin family protein [Phenylobacterium montanum]|uniref:Redoxin family protein n=1 Tax=Phenylobacterium montanum TaxID=2823693 RepID=A0A975ITM7_9CAUL|nr:redoxin family protein [Caulobacter sp. S6]QUD87032.1 redoxin family protein [Caulobacter sp. S6]